MANDFSSSTLDAAPTASDLADATQAEALNNGFIEKQQQLLYTDPDAFYGKRGEDALAATPGILHRLQDLRQETLDAAPTPAIRRRLGSARPSTVTWSSRARMSCATPGARRWPIRLRRPGIASIFSPNRPASTTTIPIRSRSMPTWPTTPPASMPVPLTAIPMPPPRLPSHRSGAMPSKAPLHAVMLGRRARSTGVPSMSWVLRTPPSSPTRGKRHRKI